MIPTKTRPLARFGYLAFALSLFLLQKRLFSRNNRPIGHARPTASDLVLKIIVQV
ncbi:TPA: hypothetical protein RUW98_004152 [Aeromonas veronii]|nr:hypothetical protein [Aeromonas veronii]HDZ8848893.1 hypothetical protein [Aeromonas veronii]